VNPDGVMATVRDYFRSILMPRSHGLIFVTETPGGFNISLGQHTPFVQLTFTETTINLTADYPGQIKGPPGNRNLLWGPTDYNFEIVPPPTSKRDRKKLAKTMAEKYHRPIRPTDDYYQSVTFDIFHEDSIPKTEFFTHCIITHIKYLVTNQGCGGWRPKGGIELTNLLEFAAKEYHKKVRLAQRRDKQ
jgi:hypothetical protein